MKYGLGLLWALLALCLDARAIKTGDNIRAEYLKMTTRYYIEAPQLTLWAEGRQMLFICNKPDPFSCASIFLALNDTTLIGVFDPADTVFMFDNNGNGILGMRTDFFFLPAWTVKRNTRHVPEDRSIVNVLNQMYDSVLQGNETHMNEELAAKYEQLRTDTTLPDRHIALLFDNYQNLISTSAQQGKRPDARTGVLLMNELSEECVATYNMIPAIVCVYMGEALLNANMEERARQHFKASLKFYPDSIPLQVYNCRLEENEKQQRSMIKDLKKKYPEHWMVKML